MGFPRTGSISEQNVAGTNVEPGCTSTSWAVPRNLVMHALLGPQGIGFSSCLFPHPEGGGDGRP